MRRSSSVGMSRQGRVAVSHLCSSALLYSLNRTIHVPATVSPVMRVGAWTEAAAAHVVGRAGASAPKQLPLPPPPTSEAHPPSGASGCALPATRRASVHSNAAAAQGRVCRAMPGALVAVLSALSHPRVGGIHSGNDTRPAMARCNATLAGMGCAIPLPQNALHRCAAARNAAACGAPPCRDAGDVRPSGCGCSRSLCCSCLSTCSLRCCAARYKPVPGARCSCLVHGATWWCASAAR